MRKAAKGAYAIKASEEVVVARFERAMNDSKTAGIPFVVVVYRNDRTAREGRIAFADEQQLMDLAATALDTALSRVAPEAREEFIQGVTRAALQWTRERDELTEAHAGAVIYGVTEHTSPNSVEQLNAFIGNIDVGALFLSPEETDALRAIAAAEGRITHRALRESGASEETIAGIIDGGFVAVVGREEVDEKAIGELSQ